MKHTFLLLIITSLFLSACSDDKQVSPKNNSSYTTNNKSTQQNLAISITDENKQSIAQISLNGSPIISYGNETITSKIGSSGKRKYLNQNGKVVAKIKSDSADKIKLKTEDGTLIWKIKTKSDSIKIADNEEMESAFKIKIKEPNRVKLLVNENEIGKATSSESVVNIKSQKQNLNITGASTPKAAVLGFDEIPLAHRLIIIAELSTK